MSQAVIVTTREDLAMVLADLMPMTMALPPDVVDLEILKRKELLTPDEVEQLYGLNARTMANKRGHGRGPSYIQEYRGGPVFYEHGAIRDYIRLCRRKSYE